MKRGLFAIFALSLAIGAPACGGATPAANSAQAARRPSDVYVDYVTAIGNVTTIKELYPYLSVSAKKRLATDLETLKSKVPGGRLKFDDERIEGNKATLFVTATIQDTSGKEKPAEGTITMLREDDGWKVDQETWKPK
jgi:hypothetical protein